MQRLSYSHTANPLHLPSLVEALSPWSLESEDGGRVLDCSSAPAAADFPPSTQGFQGPAEFVKPDPVPSRQSRIPWCVFNAQSLNSPFGSTAKKSCQKAWVLPRFTQRSSRDSVPCSHTSHGFPRGNRPPLAGATHTPLHLDPADCPKPGIWTSPERSPIKNPPVPLSTPSPPSPLLPFSPSRHLPSGFALPRASLLPSLPTTAIPVQPNLFPAPTTHTHSHLHSHTHTQARACRTVALARSCSRRWSSSYLCFLVSLQKSTLPSLPHNPPPPPQLPLSFQPFGARSTPTTVSSVALQTDLLAPLRRPIFQTTPRTRTADSKFILAALLSGSGSTFLLPPSLPTSAKTLGIELRADRHNRSRSDGTTHKGWSIFISRPFQIPTDPSLKPTKIGGAGPGPNSRLRLGQHESTVCASTFLNNQHCQNTHFHNSLRSHFYFCIFCGFLYFVPCPAWVASLSQRGESECGVSELSPALIFSKDQSRLNQDLIAAWSSRFERV
ncbi:hypothetical protein HYFRA_00010442 [Hymenoscyphus fraxineus]|uniref:Uncharacterized protein n=1 Tax=Hymenoscyphus fraxineus TaxID=746836 RepID=A0A9N9PS37_9HELO|nr:hypothetical protein HYFRA_00010442 [Hymenoscyphus fraxineus]